MKRALWPVLMVLLFAGCVTASSTRLDSQVYPPIHPDQVTIYLDEADIPGEYEKVALITLRGNYQATDEAKMFRKARKEAAKLGANGVLVQEVRDPSTGAKVAAALIGVGGDRKGEVIAIYVPPAD